MSSQYTFVFTVLASTTGFVVLACLIFLLLVARRRVMAAGIFVFTTLGAVVSTQLLKEFFMVARPEGALIEAVGYAFPSGHAMGALYLTLFFAYSVSSYQRRLRYSLYALAAVTALVVGVSRVQLGVHTPLQVAAGYLIGAFWVGVYILVYRRLKSRSGRL